MKAKLFSISLTILLISPLTYKASCNDRLSVEYANQLSERTLYWGYIASVISTAFEQLYLVTGDSSYINTIIESYDSDVTDYGELEIFSYNNEPPGFFREYSLDYVRPAYHLLALYRLTGDERYKISADTVYNYLLNCPRTSAGGFWHKEYYINQMWLDGIYMGSPFYVKYNKTFNKPENNNDVVRQIAEMFVHSWDSVKKLPYHGWYDAENDTTGSVPEWADDETGVSPVFWGRSIGWYAMALVDVLDYLPKDHPQRDSVINIFNDVAEGIAMYQDPDSLVWWQVVDQAERDSNWIESSASCMFVYALAKGVRMGYIDSVYLETATTGYQGIQDRFLDNLELRNVCTGTGVGADYTYYAERSKGTGSHGHGAFILASIEIEMMDSVYPPGLLGIDSITGKSIHISWNNNQHNVSGYILERKTDDDFIRIAELGVDTNYFSDSLIEANRHYIYRVCAYTENDTSGWSNLQQVTSANAGGLPYPAFLPFPENNAENIKEGQVLKWKRGLLADYHKLYLGTTNPPPFVADVYDKMSFTPENLNADSNYFWRIDEVNEQGTTTGETWRFYMNNILSAETPDASNSIHIYPNPTEGKIIITTDNILIKAVKIYNISGQMILSENNIDRILTNIDLSDIASGIYHILILTEEGYINDKIILE